MVDLLEDGFAAGHREIRDSRTKLDEAQASVIEDLTLLAELYSKVKDRSGVEKKDKPAKLKKWKRNLLTPKIVIKSIWMPTNDEISRQASGFL